jgi:transposase
MALPMLEALAPAKLLIADKAYDADRLRTWLQGKGIEAVIPGRAARAVVYPLNRTAYRRRNVIERMFGRLKNWKRIERDTIGSPSTISPPLSSSPRSLNGLGESPT